MGFSAPRSKVFILVLSKCQKMKKRAKSSFAGVSRNAVFLILVLAAAVTVYGIAEAAVVSHAPSQIRPQGAGSGLDADMLQGLTAADILAAAGGSLISTQTSCTASAPNFAICTTSPCPAGYVRSGCSPVCSGGLYTESCRAEPSGNAACRCEADNYDARGAGIVCYNYCIGFGS